MRFPDRSGTKTPRRSELFLVVLVAGMGGKLPLGRYDFRRGALVSHYIEGQVWEYRTRRGEERSLVKIQRIETDPETGEPVFHVSLIGLKWPRADTLAHAPVSQTTLDLSVTRLSTDQAPFPAVDDGIVEWRRAKGGVYSISLAEIIEGGDFEPSS